jgi:Ca-activated chloride channel family protein
VTRRRILSLTLIAASCASAWLPAQTPPPAATFESDVQVVSLTVVVHDKAGHFIKGLGKDDVQIAEDGVPQNVSYFREASGKAEDRIPLSVVLVLDASGSMKNSMPFLQEAASTFIHRLEDVDKALVVQFNESIKGSAEFTADLDRLDEFVEALQAWGGTSLYDAVHYGLGRVKDQPGRKAVVVFTDGADTTSDMKEQEVVDYARAVEVTVYCVGIRGEQGLLARSPRGFLRKIANETGGAFFFPEKVGELVKVFAGISDELHSHYLLSYTPKRAPDGLWRTISLKVNRKDAEVRVRKGYFAVKRKRD